MGRILIVATGGAGGDLQPLVAAGLALRDRGHQTIFMGDDSVRAVVGDLGIDVETLPPDLDLGPRLIAAVRDAMAIAAGDAVAAGPMVQQSLSAWAGEVAQQVGTAITAHDPDVAITSLFGVEVFQIAAPSCPWVVINSTFFVGPNPARPLEQDIGARAVPLIARYASLLRSADLVLHATDPVFDLGQDRLPPRHHYVGPLGIWEPPSEPPPYLRDPGDPWVLVSISSQQQDDIPLAQAAMAALADRPVRVMLTIGPHEPSEVGALTENAHLERSISHSAVLERGVLLVSHAGHGSVMKALWHGRPMVLVPWGRDQPGVAVRARALGVAEVVPREEASREALSAAIDRVLGNAEMGEASALHAARLQVTNPSKLAASLVESLL